MSQLAALLDQLKMLEARVTALENRTFPPPMPWSRQSVMHNHGDPNPFEPKRETAQ